MTVNKLKSHILKEMQLSFRLAEERELASGRKKPGTPGSQPAASKQKAAATFPSDPAEISKINKQRMDDGPPQKSKGEKQNLESKKAKSKSNKKAGQKRPVPYENTKSETSPSKKKPKRDIAFHVDNVKPKSDNTNGKGLAMQGKSQKMFKKKADDLLVKNKTVHSVKPKDSGLKITKKASEKRAIKVSKKNKKTPAEVYKVNNSKRSNENVVKEKPKKVNGSKAQYLTAAKINGFEEQTSSEGSFEDFEDNFNLQEDLDLKATEENEEDFEEDSEDTQSRSEKSNGLQGEFGFLKNCKIFKVPKNYAPMKMPHSVLFEKPKKSQLHFFEGDCQGSVRKISVFESHSLVEMDNDDSDNEYLPLNSEDLESEDFDSEESDSEDFDSEEFDSEDFDSEESDSEDFDSEDNESDEEDSDDFDDIFESDDLDSTYEPPIIDGFFDDTPPHLQKEPLIIEEIIDEHPVAQNQNPQVKLMDNDIGEIVEDIAVSQPNETPFYRNPRGTTTELGVFENSLKSNYVLAVIKENIELYGTVILTLLSGQITVNGHRPRTHVPLTIFSLKGLPWVSVSPTKTKKPVKDMVNWKELNENFTRAQLDRIQGSFQSHTDAIVLLQRNTGAQRLLETFGKHMAQNVFPQLHTSNRPYHQSESLLQCLIQNTDLSRTLIVPQVWTKLKIQAESRIMIAGGKGVGKSSLLRYLINRNLGQLPSFLLIDLDIGQPEVFVPQTVSCTLIDVPLLGPGFLLNKQPDCAFVVGHTNLVMCAEQYARAVIQLIQRIQNDRNYANIPWMINTMGYNKGFGTELMALLVDRIRPTDLIQISSPMAINNFDSPLEWSSLSACKPIIYTADEFRVNEIPRYKLHKLMSAVPPKERGTWNLSAKDMQYTNLLARLSSCLTGNAKSLTDCQTLRVPLDAVKIMHPTSEDYRRDELIQGMEANVVYLCHKEANGLPLCLGIGVVRAIDYQNQQLFLVPAMPLQRMSLVNTLILAGELTLPQGYFRDQGQEVSTSVPFVFILDDSKSSKSIQQIYHRAPAFLGVPASQKNGV